MKTEIARSTWEDVVFESRNKEYGAYILRKSYNENVSKASLMALLIAAFVFGAIQVASLLRMEIKIPSPVAEGLGIVLPPIIISDPPTFKQEIKSVKKTSNFFPIATTREPVETPPIETVDNTPVGSETGADIAPVEGIDQGGVVETISEIRKPIEIFNTAEVMPEYDGGTKALIRFISKNMRYPGSARAVGQEGTVYVRFVVNSFGQVADVEVIRGVSAVLDKEAIRVIAMMSKWKPGLQNNMPVNVRMVMPITFKLERD
jgi:protein TonB